jgi:AhpD family alkylhydroperoxidase
LHSPNAAERPRIYLDKQTPEVFESMKAAAKAARVAAYEAGLDRILIELVNLRVSQMNQCAYCLDVHTRTALKEGESPQRLGVLAAWRDTEVFTPAERAALALAEATTDLSDPAAQDAAYEAARESFDDDQLAALVWVAIAINAFNRVSILSKHPVMPRSDG